MINPSFIAPVDQLRKADVVRKLGSAPRSLRAVLTVMSVRQRPQPDLAGVTVGCE